MHPSSNEPYQQPFVQHGFVNLLNAQSSVPSYSFITNTNDFTNQASADMVHDWDMQGENGYDDDGVQDSDDDMSYDDDSSDDDSFDDCQSDEDDQQIGDDSVEKCGLNLSCYSLVNEFGFHDRLQERSSKFPQWVIPGAKYHASLPFDNSREKQQYKRDGLYHGATFPDKESMFISLGLYHLNNRVEYAIERSSKSRFSARCKLKDQCQFLMRATEHGSAWRVIKWQAPHTCLLDLRRQGPRSLSSKVIGAFFAPNLMCDGTVLRPKEMAAQLRRQFGFRIDYSVALAGRNHAIDMVYGESDNSFKLLPKYLHNVQQANPGSTVALQTSSSGCFQYAYMAIDACVHGFLSSGRPVVVVDGTHLKGKYRGMMFVATTKDGNEQVYPLAVGLGDVENDSSWIWFFTQLRRTFGCPQDLLIVSDRHPSIKKAVREVYPGIPHGVCVYHLQKNIAKLGPHVIDMFQNAANCYTTYEFDNHMSFMCSKKLAAFNKLMKIGPSRWSRSKSVVRRFGFMTSNCAESFNGRLRWARRLPVCTLLECVRSVIGHWFVERREKAMLRKYELTEHATKILEESIKEGRTMDVEAINSYKFKVSCGGTNYMVDLSTKSCSCRVFDLDLIPCSHAAAAIWMSKQSCAAYVSSYYTTEALRSMYAKDINPIPHPNEC